MLTKGLGKLGELVYYEHRPESSIATVNNFEFLFFPVSGLIREIWSPLTLKNLKSLTSNPGFPDQPSVLYNIDRFSTPREKGKRFGQRIHGFFTAPENGLYMFAVSCSDECKLFLSTDDNEAKKQEIITHPTDG